LLPNSAGLALSHLDSGGRIRGQSLPVLPDYTGGRAVLDNSPETKIGPIFDESRSCYVLAVGRDRVDSRENDKHKIKITVKPFFPMRAQ
jgi:hypothetical protein